MFTLMPWGPDVSSVVDTSVHAEGALSRRQPANGAHNAKGFALVTSVSLKVSWRVAVSSMPQLPPPAPCFMPLPPGTLMEVAVKAPSQLLGQNWGLAIGCVPGPLRFARTSSSLGDFSSLETKPPCD